jgi:hypothetical protein
MHNLTCLSPSDDCLNSEFLLESYLGTSVPTTSASSPEAQNEEYTGDFKGDYGLDYWNRRRTAWISGRAISIASGAQSPQGRGIDPVSPGIADLFRNGAPRKTSKTVAKLCEVLAPPFAEEDDAIWNNGIRAVWKSLSHGDKLKYPLPLPVVVRHHFIWSLKRVRLLTRLLSLTCECRSRYYVEAGYEMEPGQ